MQIFETRKKRNELFLILLSIALLSFLAFPLVELFLDYLRPEAVKPWVEQLGIFGPLAIVLLQAGQILAIPVPPFPPVVAGYIWGTLKGFVYGFIGGFIGSSIAILIGRKFGRPAVEFFVADEVMEKFDRFSEGHGIQTYIVFYFLPGFPDDALCYIAGLSKLDFWKLVLISSLGRMPGIALLALAGESVANSQFLLLTLIAIAGTVIAILSVEYQDRAIELLTRMEREGLHLIEAFKQELN